MASNFETLVIEAVKLQQRKDKIDERLDQIKGLFREMGKGEYAAPSRGKVVVGSPTERTYKGVAVELCEDKLDADTKTKLIDAGVIKLVDQFTKPSAAKVQIVIDEIARKQEASAA